MVGGGTFQSSQHLSQQQGKDNGLADHQDLKRVLF